MYTDTDTREKERPESCGQEHSGWSEHLPVVCMWKHCHHLSLLAQ
jgi:hypothetical protein